MIFKKKRTVITFLILFLITFSVYVLSYRGEGKHLNYFVPLADAFLHGRFYLLDSPPWLNELIKWNNHFYVVYPPMPAVLLIPFVAIFGTRFEQPILSILLGAMNVSLSYLVFKKIFDKENISIWLSILYGFGTMQWFHAEVGSTWYIAHIVALFFLWLMLIEILNKQRLFLIGVLIGCAYLSRLPTILAIIFPLIFLNDKFFNFKEKRFSININNLILLFSGLLIFVFLNFGYNYVRYGVIYDISYSLLPIFHEPWYKYGLFNIKNIPIHLTEILTALPKFSKDPPYIIPSLYVLALWFVTPAFLLMIFAKFKTRIIFVSLVTLLIMAIPSLAHGSNGFTQFGFRFALDYMPFLLILTGSGYSQKNNLFSKGLIVLSILVNLWGVVMVSIFGKWTF